MSILHEIRVPDLGSVADAEVIGIAVAVGDAIDVESTLITLETEKASMDVPSPVAGQIQQVLVAVGQKVAKGTLIAVVKTRGADSEQLLTAVLPEKAIEAVSTSSIEMQSVGASDQRPPVLIAFPDLGTPNAVSVIDILKPVGASIIDGEYLVTLESDKASMDVPSNQSGVILEWLVAVGDQVNTGTPFVKIQPVASGAPLTVAMTSVPVEVPMGAKPTALSVPVNASIDLAASLASSSALAHAGPATRRLARELGVDLGRVSGTGHRQRITTEDVKLFVKSQLQSGAVAGSGMLMGSGLNVAPMPVVDFSAFGPTETKALNKIKKLTARNLHRNWVSIPHVTHNEDADITEMEAFRQEQKEAMAAQGIRLTPLVFIMKAVVNALRAYPQFNASLSSDGESLVLKNYFHIGVAVDTPNGLVVPVIRDVDKKGLLDLAKELAAISDKAKKVGLSLSDMQGGCFTISSLGGIGGTSFTPIINAPEVAILGLSKSKMQPVYKEGLWMPRLMLPLSLSYDHRVIDGAEAARFSVHLAQQLADIRCLLL